MVMLLGLTGLMGTVSNRAIQVSECSSTEVRLSLTDLNPEFKQEVLGGRSYNSPSLEGAEYSATEACPSLPLYSGYVAIPAQGDYEISYSYKSYKTYPGVTPKPASGDDKTTPAPSAQVYEGQSAWPEDIVSFGESAWIRDFRVLPMNVNPMQYDPVSGSIRHYQGIEIRLRFEADAGPSLGYQNYSSEFDKIYEANILNFDNLRALIVAPLQARILIVYGNSTDATFQAKLAEFVAWKRQKGFEVNTASTVQTGGSSTNAIKNYLQGQYNNLDTRPDYVIIIGDANGTYAIPAYFETESGYNGEGDYPYTFLAGNDSLGDVFIGRLSAENLSQLATLFAKVYTYEKNVQNQGPAAAWMDRMLLIGDPSTSGQSCVYVTKYIREIAKRAHPPYTFVENYSSGFTSTINSGINQGVGFFSYRGYYNTSGWNPSPSSLQNGFKLPHTAVITCGTGSYASGTSQSEAFFRMGSESVPAGAVTCIGMATTGTHTMLNNVLSAGIFTGIYTFGMRSFGEALLHGRLYLNSTYGVSHPSHARRFAHWCNLMGDPSLETWVGIPQNLIISVPDTIPVGTAWLDVNVKDDDQIPLQNISVTAYTSSGGVISKGFTDAAGNILLHIPAGTTSNLLITASAHDFKPSQVNVVMDSAGSLVWNGQTLLEDGTQGSNGNADSFANPGETVALWLELRNSTVAALSGISASLTSDDPWLQISSATASYPDLASETSAANLAPFIINVAGNIPPQHLARMNLQIADSNSQSYDLIFNLPLYNASLIVSSYSVLDGTNYVLDPGETSNLSIQIHNNSVCGVSDVYAELQALNDMVQVTDDQSWFGGVLPGTSTTSVDGFAVLARPALIPGMQIPMRLRMYNAQGFEQFSTFNLPIGTVSQTTPLGPDEYGYLIYDVTDTGYPDCPSYSWDEISPTLGGSGSAIAGFIDPSDGYDEGDIVGAVSTQVVPLPFPFRFYGVDYEQITVCSNGFVAMGVTEDGDYRNVHIPGGQGPSPMIAAFWDDLCMAAGSAIYKYHNAMEHTFIIQYQGLKNGYNGSSEETFQLIFYDPLYYPTGMGDGAIKIQYKVFNNIDIGSNSGYTPLHGNYATIGIKDHTNTRGLEYSFNNQYPSAAAPLSNQKALFITTVPVIHQNPYLVMGETYLYDSNQNGVVQPGETCELGLKLTNIGLDNATMVTVSISTLNPNVTVTSGQSTYPDIASSQSQVNVLPFQFYVSPDCLDGSIVNFNCRVEIDGNSWNYPWTCTVKKAHLELTSMFINDSQGNGNGILESGESFFLILNFQNDTPVDASNLISNIGCVSEHVQILNPMVQIDTVPAGGFGQAVYPVALSDTTPLGTFLTFFVTFAGDEIASQNEQLIVSVGTTGLNADFEYSDGAFIASPVTNGWQWGASNPAGAHSGTKVWGTRLNELYPNNVNWTLTSPAVQLGTNYVLEFWHRYAMEATYDGGNVKISVNNGASWSLLTPEGGYNHSSVAALNGPGYSGTQDWTEARYNLSAYANQQVRFRWTFASDTMIQGDGWFIDDVRTSGAMEYAGMLSGTVTSDNPSAELDQVEITSSLGVGTKALPDGAYQLFLPLGTHTVQASQPGYQSETADNLILTPANSTVIRDFLLPYYAPVTGLSHQILEDQLSLSWVAPTQQSLTCTGFKVMRRFNAGAFECVITQTQTAYSETIISDGSYRYYVLATYDTGVSLASETWSFEYPVTPNPEDDLPQLVTGLYSNYPNPFNPSTTIRFSLAQAMKASLRIYNSRGQLVNTLLDAALPAGQHSLVWNGKDGFGRDVASGVYFYRLSAGSRVMHRKMLLLK